MRFSSTITSKGTITIAAPLRKALGIKPGQKITMDLTADNRLVLDTGTDMQSFREKRSKITKKIPDHLKGLSGDALREAAARAWASGKKR